MAESVLKHLSCGYSAPGLLENQSSVIAPASTWAGKLNLLYEFIIAFIRTRSVTDAHKQTIYRLTVETRKYIDLI